MLSIFNNSNEKIELNSIFIQPYWNCERYCKECYVRLHKNKKTHLPHALWHKFLDEINKGEKIQCNQLTLSINKGYLPNEFQQLIYSLSFGSLKKIEERHITIYSIEDLLQVNPERCLQFINTISLSEINLHDLDQIRELRKKCKINWNLKVESYLQEEDFLQYIETIRKIAKEVDYIYLFLHKDIYHLEDKFINRDVIEDFYNRVRVINRILKIEPDLKSKISVDTCLKSAYQGKKCSAGISSLQVWPDGTVSGCPYTSISIGKETSSIEDLFHNIKEVIRNGKKENKSCYIQSIYNHERKKISC